MPQAAGLPLPWVYCSSFLIPGHCPGDLLAAPMDTTCNISGPTGTQSALQTNCPSLAWVLPASACLEASSLFTSLISADKLLCHAYPHFPPHLLPSSWPQEHLPLVKALLFGPQATNPSQHGPWLCLPACLSPAKKCPLTQCGCLCGPGTHTLVSPDSLLPRPLELAWNLGWDPARLV